MVMKESKVAICMVARTLKGQKLQVDGKNRLLFAQATPHDAYKFCAGRCDSADGAPDDYCHVDAIVQAS